MKKNKEFYIARIEEETSASKDQNFGKFVAPYSGRNVSNKEVYPYVEYGNNAQQYQGLDSSLVRNKQTDKYSPDRIPSYLRREDDNSGISKHNIADLKGEKLSLDEMRRRNSSYLRGQGTDNPTSPLVSDKENISKEDKWEALRREVRLQQDIYEGRIDRDSVEGYQKPKPKQVASEYQQTPVYMQDVKYQEPVKYEEEYVDEYEDEFDENDYEESKQYIESEVKPVYKKSELAQTPSYVNNNPTMGIRSENKDDFYANELYNNQASFTHVNRGYQPETPQSRGYQESKTIRAKVEPMKPEKKVSRRKRRYAFPPLDLLNRNGGVNSNNSDVNFQINTINSTLEEFRIGGSVQKYVKGPTVTQFEIKLNPGVKVNKIETIARNLQMNLASDSIRIEAPIPGKASVGIEVPNPVRDKVLFGDLVARKEYINDGKPLNIVLGQQIDGTPKYLDITSMPHALVAGATGSGKTVCLYSILVSILYKATPEEVKLILIDPKSNELTFFADIPHLACPIIDDPKIATASIKWAVDEMQRRYALLKAAKKRTIVDFNNYVEETGEGAKMPYIVIVIDEFADLMNTVSDSFEDNVQRITQKARSAGIHMIIATQRPSTDVLKGTIKANITTRIAFNVNSQIDSLTILDHVGADKLLGKGDMLYYNGSNDIRVQGAYIDETEIERVADFLVSQNDVDYMFTLDELQTTNDDGFAEDDSALFEKVARHIVTYRNASMNHLQRTFKIGYNTADDIMQQLEEMGVVSPVVPGRQRTVQVDIEELERLLYNRR